MFLHRFFVSLRRLIYFIMAKNTKDLKLTDQFHHLYNHTEFAITDFIYVRKFRTEINIEITK